MTVSKVGQTQLVHQIEQFRIQDKRNEDYAKVVDRRRFDQIVAERVSKNLRLGLDKGQNIDIEC
jgi:hypothetical protein